MKIAFIALKLALICSFFINEQASAQLLTCTDANGNYVDDSYARVKLDHPFLEKYRQNPQHKSAGLPVQQANDNRLHLLGSQQGLFNFVLNNFGNENSGIIFSKWEDALSFCNSLAEYCKKTVFPSEPIDKRPADGSSYRYVLVGYDGWSALSFKYINVYYRKDDTIKYSVCPNHWHMNFPNIDALLHYGKLR
jgi:hypothetical protein